MFLFIILLFRVLTHFQSNKETVQIFKHSSNIRHTNLKNWGWTSVEGGNARTGASVELSLTPPTDAPWRRDGGRHYAGPLDYYLRFGIFRHRISKF